MKPLQALFIGGFPKSGTTLLATLLDSHPELMVFPEETHIFSMRKKYTTIKTRRRYLRRSSGASTPGMDEAVLDFPSGKRDYSFVDKERYKDQLRTRLSVAKNLRELFEAILKNWMEFDIYRDNNQWKYFVEKTPFNELYHRKAMAWYPDAKFIYIVRDPRDNLLSYSKKQPKKTLDELIAMWRASYQAARELMQKDQVLVIRYEDLVAAPRATMRDVASFLSIGFNEVLTQPTRMGMPWEGNSMFGDNAKSIHRKSKGRYKTLMTREQRLYIEGALYEPMQAMGYKPSLAMRWRQLRAKLGLRVETLVLPVEAVLASGE
ncbi:MAG: sulfotransferase [Rickettsiales bacterium]|nr:sulfotransferase [Rickettsiales bacterium]